MPRTGLAVLFWVVGVFFWIWTGPAERQGATADYAIVLGAAVYGDIPSPVFAARIDHAIDLWRDGRVRRIIFTGGRAQGDALSEAEAASRYARDRGVEASAIVTEGQSRTTVQNLEFSRPENLGIAPGTVLLVSDPLHLRRAMVMARTLGYDAQPSATRTTRYQSASTRVPFAMREVFFMHTYWLIGE